ncbi:MAG: alpha/beta fold hydrolase [Bacteriovoracaceae bacterium]|nr:alpha/beta fold hydrolase [Bacteriovoracaceae bacterium]
MNYLDEGQGEPVVMLHGNPTWSFYYRNLVKGLKENYRVIVPDHIGCGLSDKPQQYSYKLKNHIDNVEKLLDHMGITNFHLVVHDWGGAIGMGLATRNPSRIKSVTLLNTAAFTDAKIPARINICKIPVVGERLVRHLNGFAWPATFMAVENKLSKDVKKGYLLPYNNYKNRIATAKFVQDIPMSQNHESYSTLLEIEKKLDTVTCPKLILWGAKDFCFNMHFFNRWTKFYPDAKTKVFADAGHYVLEDKKEETLEMISSFLGDSQK